MTCDAICTRGCKQAHLESDEGHPETVPSPTGFLLLVRPPIWVGDNKINKPNVNLHPLKEKNTNTFID